MAHRQSGGRGVNRRIEIVPSILSADLTRLGEQVREAVEGGADRIQVDVMDGHFVPNLTFGPAVVAAVRNVTDLPIEAHLMVEHPDLFIQQFARAGATLIIVQVESTTSLYRTVTRIKDLNVKAAVAINPATGVETVREIAPYIDMVNVMTVEPGFGGQAFIPSSPEKIRRLREVAPEVEIEVDGGIDPETAPVVAAAGATVLVAGSAVYAHKQGVKKAIESIRQAAQGALM
jgi:ribulose-phosphate 3-epimerase